MAEELHELHERAEEAHHDPSLAPVTLTMAILAVVVAAVSLLGHRAHTEEILLQTKATDQWAYYQAKDIRKRNYELFLDELTIFTLKDSDQVGKVREKYSKEVERYRGEQKEIESDATKFEEEVAGQRRRGDRFDLGEVLLEAALVITSITLLTRKRLFWAFGSALGLAGIIIAISGFFLH